MPFTCALCSDYAGSGTVAMPVAVEPKLDGVRCLADVGPAGVVYWTRTGRQLPDLPHISRALSINPPLGMMLDGELIGESFGATLSALKTNPEALRFVVFDALPSRMFRERDGRRTADAGDYMPRRTRLTTIGASFGPGVSVVPSVEAITWNQVEAAYRRYRSEGYEGAVLKNLFSGYPWGRSRMWTKLKPEVTVEGRIVEVIGGSGRFIDGMVGALGVEVGGVATGVGSGFLDSERRELWTRRAELVGKHVEFTAQERLESGAYRFPAFVRLRPDLDRDGGQ